MFSIGPREVDVEKVRVAADRRQTGSQFARRANIRSGVDCISRRDPRNLVTQAKPANRDVFYIEAANETVARVCRRLCFRDDWLTQNIDLAGAGRAHPNNSVQQGAWPITQIQIRRLKPNPVGVDHQKLGDSNAAKKIAFQSVNPDPLT